MTHLIPERLARSHGPPKSSWAARAHLNNLIHGTFTILEQVYQPDREWPLLKTWLHQHGLRLITRAKLRDGNPFQLATGMYSISAVRHKLELTLGAWRFDIPDLASYELDTIPDGAKWRGDGTIPEIGSTVRLKRDGLGSGRVLDYTLEGGLWLGARVLLDDPPDELFSQFTPYIFVTGEEIEPCQPCKPIESSI